MKRIKKMKRMKRREINCIAMRDENRCYSIVKKKRNEYGEREEWREEGHDESV